MFGFSLDTHSMGAGVLAPRRNVVPRESGCSERGKWDVLMHIRHFANADIDWFRARYGKEEGERRFFAEYEPDDVDIVRGNMLMGNGASALWQYALGNGTTTANSALGSGPTYLNNSQTYLYVGDGGITAGSGTVSVTNNSTSVTFSTSQSGLQGKYLVVTGDSTSGLYIIASGSGTSWTLATAYGGSTNASASWSSMTAESHSQTALSASSNIAHQIMDATFPANSPSANFNAISNVSGNVLTISGGDISTNDIVQVYEVEGISGVNGMWVANPATSTSVTLLGASGSGSYTYGGIVTKRSVMKFQATFGPGIAQWASGWYEWGIFNGTGANQVMLNRKCAFLGVKSAGSTSLQVGIGQS